MKMPTVNNTLDINNFESCLSFMDSCEWFAPCFNGTDSTGRYFEIEACYEKIVYREWLKSGDIQTTIIYRDGDVEKYIENLEDY